MSPSEKRNANENAESWRTAPILRRQPERGKSGNSEGLRSRARHAAFRIAAQPFTFSRLAHFARLTRETEPAPVHYGQHHSSRNENHLSVADVPERSSSTGELINALLRIYTLAQIRAMFPGLFPNPGPGG